MTIRRIHRATDLTPEQVAERDAIRASFQAAKPTLDELVASGDYAGPMLHGDFMASMDPRPLGEMELDEKIAWAAGTIDRAIHAENFRDGVTEVVLAITKEAYGRGFKAGSGGGPEA